MYQGFLFGRPLPAEQLFLAMNVDSMASHLH
jgi:EAL domain-containing protein (putative c-di-GMP-specific phosphodiesterase class I)